jgi:hypothetical protein
VPGRGWVGRAKSISTHPSREAVALRQPGEVDDSVAGSALAVAGLKPRAGSQAARTAGYSQRAP